jgi:hypothetical protein
MTTKLTTIGLLFAVLALGGSANAAPPLMVTPVEAKTMLERNFDHARCLGVARLGSRVWRGKREYRFLDCTTATFVDGKGNVVCTLRWKAAPAVPDPKSIRGRHGRFYMQRDDFGIPCRF